MTARKFFQQLVKFTFVIAVLTAIEPASAQSCSGNKLCPQTYKVISSKHSNVKHQGITIEVRNPLAKGFDFAPGTQEHLDCDDPEVMNGGDALSCAKRATLHGRDVVEIVTVGVVDGNFCKSLQQHTDTKGIGQFVIDKNQCSALNKTDCLCFRVEWYCAVDDDKDIHLRCDKTPGASGGPGVMVPPGRGTGSGGSP